MNKFKIILDIIMTILMILLMKIEFLGLQTHEIIGITIFILFIIHKVLNYKFIKAIGKNIFNKKIKLNSKIMFILDIILLCVMFMNVLTGLLISKFVLKGLIITNIKFITMIHKSIAWWSLMLISIHIGLHLDRLVNYLARKYKILKNNNIIKVMFLIIYFAFAILGVKSLCKYSVYSKIIPIQSNSPQNTQERKYKNRRNNNNSNNNEEKNKESIRNNENNNRKGRSKSNMLDVLNVMFLFTGGTYYINVLFKNKIKN